MRQTCTIIGVAVLCSMNIASTAGGQAPSASARDGGTIGLDHIPIAVANLEQAADRYKALGFALKPGRPHDNGIRNQHVKFRDGTELELITAPEARDALTTKYRVISPWVTGRRFLALYAPGRPRGPESAVPDYIFFGPRNSSPTDRPEHFAHPNGAESFIAVWLAGDDLTRERQLLTRIGANTTNEDPRSAHRRCDTPSEEPRRGPVLAQGPAGAQTAVTGSGYSSMFLPPDLTHGLWLELRELR
ncbi:MAG: VOC family protein [Acidobacteria bacterium]|nr:VOC family protein [Acidobacteriota bacterium]